MSVFHQLSVAVFYVADWEPGHCSPPLDQSGPKEKPITIKKTLTIDHTTILHSKPVTPRLLTAAVTKRAECGLLEQVHVNRKRL